MERIRFWRNSDSAGQTLVEFLIFLGPLFLLILLIGRQMSLEWNRLSCAYLTFEATYARSIGVREHSLSQRIQVKEEQDRWVGQGQCDGVTERVELPKLEDSKW